MTSTQQARSPENVRPAGHDDARAAAVRPPDAGEAREAGPAGDPLADYPLSLGLAGKRVVVIGGSAVALRRTRSLLAAGARVHVIAPQISQELAGLGVIREQRRYRDGDLAGAWLAHAATDDPAVNAAVCAEAERSRVWCVRADDGAASPARTPAVTRHGDVTVAVTAGGDPRRSQRLRAAISAALAAGRLPVRRQRPAGPAGPGTSRWSAAVLATPG